MAGSQQAIKARIASVNSTKKITNAMQMVASAKLNKARSQMDANREYADSLQELLSMVLSRTDAGSRLLQEDPSKPSFVFVIASDMGLCGAYNSNVFKTIQNSLKDDDILVVVGSRGASWAKARNKNIHEVLINLNEDNAYEELAREMDKAIEMYKNGEIGAVKVLYTHYKNTLTYEPTLENLLPPTPQEISSEKKVRRETIFEPNKQEMLEQLIPMITKSVVYAKYMESKTSEQASRRMARETATDNAEELIDKLNLEFNRLRQGAITQEITEIVSGANALK